jgi:hypothetical protein
VPTLKPGDIVIFDNLGSHKGKAVRKAIRAARRGPSSLRSVSDEQIAVAAMSLHRLLGESGKPPCQARPCGWLPKSCLRAAQFASQHAHWAIANLARSARKASSLRSITWSIFSANSGDWPSWVPLIVSLPIAPSFSCSATRGGLFPGAFVSFHAEPSKSQVTQLSPSFQSRPAYPQRAWPEMDWPVSSA